ncbi:isocitrate dehydrogenase [Phakopsora pachyrhizi]|nr:isocitrate dehydrogenase [Phakopsora pachyrhizi]
MSKLNQTLRIGLIPGDGIGKFVIPAAQRALKSTPGLPKISFVNLEAGFELFNRTGVSLPQSTIDSLRNECDCALFGAVSSPSHKVEGYSSPIVRLRKELNLYANIRPIQSISKKIEITVVRENTECLYVKQESISSNDPYRSGKVARAIRIISQEASEKIGKMAAEVALKGAAVRSQISESERIWKDKPKVTIVHKSNVLSISDGLFRESVRSIFEGPGHDQRFDEIKVEEGIVDSLIYNLYRKPHDFNVLVCPNLYGDIVS